MSECLNTEPCPCTSDCPRHGRCCACVAHHRANGVPGCFFTKEGEAKKDRSFAAFVKDRGLA